ncbi:MAG: hypothetical protein AB7O97_10860 [Planctomycetota bacterium]
MSQARAELYRWSSECARYRRELGIWPDLAALAAAKDLPADDPWGRPYLLEVAADGAAAAVRCCGDDGFADSCDDVVSPTARAPADRTPP